MTDHSQTMPCRVCRHDVPAGRFCGRCGAHLTHARSEGPDWLRIRDYAATPGEHVLRPSIVSSMFPHLPSRSQGAFRVGVVLVLIALVVSSVLRMPLVMVVAATFAPPVLIVIYLVETGVLADLPRRVWALTFATGVAVGVGWAMLTTAIVADSYRLGVGTEVPTFRLVLDALTIPFGALLAMQLPAVLIRLTRPPGRESLYGFVIGATGATMFAVGATVVRVIPEIPDALSATDQPVGDLLVEAGVRGFTMPVTAASVGGLFGAGLWYARHHQRGHGRFLAIMAVGALTAATLYAVVGLVDAFRVAPNIQFVVHVAIALTAVVALRVGLQLAMLHEPHEAVGPELPILCPECAHVVPDMAFCPACGVASHASSRTSREARRRDRPKPSEERVHG